MWCGWDPSMCGLSSQNNRSCVICDVVGIPAYVVCTQLARSLTMCLSRRHAYQSRSKLQASQEWLTSFTSMDYKLHKYGLQAPQAWTTSFMSIAYKLHEHGLQASWAWPTNSTSMAYKLHEHDINSHMMCNSIITFLPLDMRIVIVDSDMVKHQMSARQTWCLILCIRSVWCSPGFCLPFSNILNSCQ